MSVRPDIEGKCLRLSPASSSAASNANALEIIDFYIFLFLFAPTHLVRLLQTTVYIYYIYVRICFAGLRGGFIHGFLQCNRWPCVYLPFMSTQVQSNPLSFFFAFIIFFKKKKIMLLCDWWCIKQESLAFKAYEALQYA